MNVMASGHISSSVMASMASLIDKTCIYFHVANMYINMLFIDIKCPSFFFIVLLRKLSHSNEHNEARMVRWSRLACFDDGELVVSSNCTTDGETSMDAAKKVDETWIIRPTACFNN